MSDRVEPDTGGFISGPMIGTPDSEAVIEAAYEALCAFAGNDLNRERAQALLPLWGRRHLLTSREFATVVTRFPAAAKRRQRECNG